MIIFKTAETLTRYILSKKNSCCSIGFVPTMGALHCGHLSLITSSLHANDFTVCSVFVNPTQFNNREDFKHYPVSIEKDIEKLEAAGCSILFLPNENEIYPPDYTARHFNLGAIEKVLEGEHRPGHFQGVCQVVDILLTIVQPDNLYLGQKDFQQCLVINQLLAITGRTNTVSLHIMPTKRESDGLAMSSRNLRLTEEQRRKAPVIFETLMAIKQQIESKEIALIQKEAKEKLEKAGFSVDYVAIATTTELGFTKDISSQNVALIAASIGNIRLIDNLLLQ